RQPAGIEGGGCTREKAEAARDAGGDTLRRRSERRARGSEGGKCGRPDRARLRIRGRLSAVKYRARYDPPILLEQSIRLAAQTGARGQRRRDLTAARRAGRPADARRRGPGGRRGSPPP